jgi:hypothetical protein
MTKEPKVKKPVVSKSVARRVAIQKAPAKAYHLKMEFNDQVIELETDDLAASITENRPHFLKTKIIFTITNADGKVWEKAFFVHQGKQVLRNKLALSIMLNRLIFK